MAGLTGVKPSASYQSLLRVNDNTGIDSSLEVIEDGAGNDSPIKVSTTNVTVLDHQINTQYAYFGTTSTDALPSSTAHTSVPFGSLFGSNDEVTFGSGTDPATTLTISNTADDLVPNIMYLPNDVTIDGVYVWVAGSAANGDTIKFHLMSYTIVTTDGSTCGNLSSGTVIADGDDIVHDGYEQADFQTMDIQSANIDAGKAVLFMIKSGGVNSDYSINATVKYHLR